MSLQWGNLGEWAGAIGTSAAVLITAFTLRRDHQDRRQVAALNVVPSVGQTGGPPGPNGEPTTYMVVTVTNNGLHAVRDVHLDLTRRDGSLVDSHDWKTVAPLAPASYTRHPAQDEFSSVILSGRTFDHVATVTFTVDGRRWRRDTESNTVLMGRVSRWRRQTQLAT